VATDLISYWWIGLIAIVVIIFIVIAVLMRRRNSKPKIASNECKHDFKLAGVLMFYEKYPRIIYYCNKCGYAIHKPIAKSI